MGAPGRTVPVVLASVMLLGGCSGAAAPASPVPTATPPPTAAPTPSPTATPDVAGFADDALAILRDPDLAIEFAIAGEQLIAGTTFDAGGSIVIVGPALSAVFELQPFDIASSEISVDGAVYLRDGDGRWVRDDQAPAAVPAFATAWVADTAVADWEEAGTGTSRTIVATLADVDLQVLLMSMGMADPGTSGAEGTVALLLSPSGELEGLQIDAVYTPGVGSDEMDASRTLSVTTVGTAGEAGMPVVEPPDDFWLRNYSENLGYLLHYPPSMQPSTADNVEYYKGRPPHQMGISAGMVEAGKTLDSIADAEIARLKEMGVVIVSDETVTLDEAPARRVEISFKDGGKPYWGLKTMSVHEDVWYDLAWIDLAANREAGLPVLEEMLESFQSGF